LTFLSQLVVANLFGNNVKPQVLWFSSALIPVCILNTILNVIKLRQVPFSVICNTLKKHSWNEHYWLACRH